MQIESKKKEYLSLIEKINEKLKEQELNYKFFMKEKKIAYETLKIIGDEVVKARKEIDKIENECLDHRKAIKKLQEEIKCLQKQKLESS